MTPVIYSFSELDPSKWIELVNNQEGNVSFYDWPLLESDKSNSDDNKFVAVILEDNGNYLMALPGTVRSGIFSNFFWRTFDNLDIIIRNDVPQQQRNLFVKFIHEKFAGLILRNFRSESLLFKNDRKFIAGPSRNCPYMDLPECVEKIFPEINKSFKKTLRWNLNGLPKTGITTEVISGKKVQEVFEKEFIPAHNNRMNEKKIKSGFSESHIQDFFMKVNNHDDSGSMLTVARLNGEFAGGIYGIRNRSVYSYIASGIRTDIEKFSLGQFLIFKTMEYLIGEHCKRFDFLRGMESYKTFWTKSIELNESRYYYNNSTIIPVFRIFLNDNRYRYGRMKCLKLLLRSWSQTGRAIH